MHSRSRAEKARAPRRAAIMETLAMKVRASRREELLPLPRGEGWGEGVRASEQKLGLPNPLILSFSPSSAFTRVFDALWGRRDAAGRPRHAALDAALGPAVPNAALEGADSSGAYKRKTGTGETPVHEHDPEKWGPVFRKIMLTKILERQQC